MKCRYPIAEYNDIFSAGHPCLKRKLPPILQLPHIKHQRFSRIDRGTKTQIQALQTVGIVISTRLDQGVARHAIGAQTVKYGALKARLLGHVRVSMKGVVVAM